jgi:AcrR family transcriptional regulator
MGDTIEQILSQRTADPILDAARATVIDFGVRRTTVSEVARRAGVSRMTVYRRYPDGDTLIREVMAREFGAVFEQAVEATAGARTPRERLVAEIAWGVDHMLVHPVLRRLLEIDAEILLPYYTDHRGRFQELIVARMADVIAEGHRTGDIRAGDPVRMAQTLELALRGVVLGARMFDDPDERRRVVADLTDLVERYLEP